MTTFNGTLAVTISDAQHTTPQRGSQQDPYCIVTLGSSGAKRFLEGSSLGKERFKTKVHTNAGQHPIWNETHNFNLKNMKLDSHLKVKLYDKDTLKDDYIGLAQIDLQELHLHDKKGVQYFPLFKKGMLGQEKASIGRVGVGVQFNCTEIPQGHADLKSQVRDVAVRKQQQMAGVAEPYQQAKPTHIQGPVQMQQGYTQPGYQTGTGPMQQTGFQQTDQQTGMGMVPQQQGYSTTVPQGQMGTQTKGTFVPQTTQGTHMPQTATHIPHQHHYQ